MFALFYVVALQSIISTLVLSGVGLIIGAAVGGVLGIAVGFIANLFFKTDALVIRVAFAGGIAGAIIGAVWAFLIAPR